MRALPAAPIQRTLKRLRSTTPQGTMNTTLTVRPVCPSDIAALTALLNEIIAIGGTTAYETPLSEDGMAAWLLEGAGLLSCQIAVREAVLGFQVLEHHAGLSKGWADIATFARARPKVPGVGRALFTATRALAEAEGVRTINATIRADNTGGLAYYTKMGFRDYAIRRCVPLSSGRRVDRISKRFDLA
ncbi:MAG: GNAT family N-acetyltransferase [Pseudomonadota bacterium]